MQIDRFHHFDYALVLGELCLIGVCCSEVYLLSVFLLLQQNNNTYYVEQTWQFVILQLKHTDAEGELETCTRSQAVNKLGKGQGYKCFAALYSFVPDGS